jgi:tyrosine-protein phosphatase SIW14
VITQVTEGIYRGPRPTYGRELSALHIRTMISLEGEEEDQDEVQKFPAIQVISLPIVFWQIYVSGISQAYFAQILGEIYAAPKPLLIHCQHGEDRTGLVIAGYRMKMCYWTRFAAEEERNKFGYRWWLNFGLNRTWKAFQ